MACALAPPNLVPRASRSLLLLCLCGTLPWVTRFLADQDWGLGLVGHRVNDVVDSKTDRLRAVLERLVAMIEIFPEIADIVVVIRDHLEVAVLVRHSPELRNKVSIGRIHLQCMDIEETMKDRMTEIDLDEFPFRQRPLQVVAQDLQ